MARIREYELDRDLEINDKVLGTDGSGFGTMNFSIEQLGEFLASRGLADPSALDFQFQHVDRVDGSISEGGISYNSTAPIELTSVYIGATDLKGLDTEPFAAVLVGTVIEINDTQASQGTDYGFYDVTNSVAIQGGFELTVVLHQAVVDLAESTASVPQTEFVNISIIGLTGGIGDIGPVGFTPEITDNGDGTAAVGYVRVTTAPAPSSIDLPEGPQGSSVDGLSFQYRGSDGIVDDTPEVGDDTIVTLSLDDAADTDLPSFTVPSGLTGDEGPVGPQGAGTHGTDVNVELNGELLTITETEYADPSDTTGTTTTVVNALDIVGDDGIDGTHGTDIRASRNGDLLTITQTVYANASDTVGTTTDIFRDVDVVGDDGAAGDNGRTLLSGASEPVDSTTGEDGDFYIQFVDADSTLLFGPRTSGLWGTGIELQGTDGATFDPATLTGDITATTAGVVTIVDDSHNHIIANVDGLQDALDTKPNIPGTPADTTRYNLQVTDGGIASFEIIGGTSDTDTNTHVTITDGTVTTDFDDIITLGTNLSFERVDANNVTLNAAGTGADVVGAAEFPTSGNAEGDVVFINGLGTPQEGVYIFVSGAFKNVANTDAAIFLLDDTTFSEEGVVVQFTDSRVSTTVNGNGRVIIDTSGIGDGASVSQGTALPTSGDQGDLFYLNTATADDEVGLYIHNGGDDGDRTDWDLVGQVDTDTDTHISVLGSTGPITGLPGTATDITSINFTGAAVTDDGSGAVTVAISTSGTTIDVLDEGMALTTAATTLNFTGGGVSATGTGTLKTINVPGGGAGVEIVTALPIGDLSTSHEAGDLVSLTGTDNDGLYRLDDQTTLTAVATSDWIESAEILDVGIVELPGSEGEFSFSILQTFSSTSLTHTHSDDFTFDATEAAAIIDFRIHSYANIGDFSSETGTFTFNIVATSDTSTVVYELGTAPISSEFAFDEVFEIPASTLTAATSYSLQIVASEIVGTSLAIHTFWSIAFEGHVQVRPATKDFLDLHYAAIDQDGTVIIQDEGDDVGVPATTLNFVGTEISATGAGTTKEINVNIPTFLGATDSVAGIEGSVPLPLAGEQDYILYGDGEWELLSLKGDSIGAALPTVTTGYQRRNLFLVGSSATDPAGLYIRNNTNGGTAADWDIVSLSDTPGTVTAGTYGSGTTYPQLTVDEYGRITAIGTGNILFEGAAVRVTLDNSTITVVEPGGIAYVDATHQYYNLSGTEDSFGPFADAAAAIAAFEADTNYELVGDGSGGDDNDFSVLSTNPLNYGVGAINPIRTEISWEDSSGDAFIGNADNIIRSSEFENISTTGTEDNSLFPSILIEEVPVDIYTDWITADADTFSGYLGVQELTERGRSIIVRIDESSTVNGSTADFRDVTADIVEVANIEVDNTTDNIVTGYTINHNGVAEIPSTSTIEWNVIEIADARRTLTHILQRDDETLEVTTDMTVNRQLNVASINPSRAAGEPQFNVLTDAGDYTTSVIPVADTTTLRFSTANNTTIQGVFDGLTDEELFCTLQDTSIAAQTTITETGVGNIYRVTAAGLGGVSIERATLTNGGGFTEATGANLAFTFFTAIQTTANRVLFPGDVEFLGSVFGIDEAAIDQTYDGTSTRAQSGTAVAEAIAPAIEDISFQATPTAVQLVEQHIGSGVANAFVNISGATATAAGVLTRDNFIKIDDLPDAIPTAEDAYELSIDSSGVATWTIAPTPTGITGINVLETGDSSSPVSNVQNIRFEGLGVDLSVEGSGANRTAVISIAGTSAPVSNEEIDNVVFSIPDFDPQGVIGQDVTFRVEYELSAGLVADLSSIVVTIPYTDTNGDTQTATSVTATTVASFADFTRYRVEISVTDIAFSTTVSSTITATVQVVDTDTNTFTGEDTQSFGPVGTTRAYSAAFTTPMSIATGRVINNSTDFSYIPNAAFTVASLVPDIFGASTTDLSPAYNSVTGAVTISSGALENITPGGYTLRFQGTFTETAVTTNTGSISDTMAFDVYRAYYTGILNDDPGAAIPSPYSGLTESAEAITRGTQESYIYSGTGGATQFFIIVVSNDSLTGGEINIGFVGIPGFVLEPDTYTGATHTTIVVPFNQDHTITINI